MDDGETAVATGLRCFPEYQGLGMTTKLMAASLEMAKTNFPHLKIRAKTMVTYGECDKYKEPYRKNANITSTRVRYLILVLTCFKELDNENCET